MFHSEAIKILAGMDMRLPYCSARNMAMLYVVLTFCGGIPILIYMYSVYISI